jgi:uncharacterized protein with von Willebrand factor type A (vWA) domain
MTNSRVPWHYRATICNKEMTEQELDLVVRMSPRENEPERQRERERERDNTNDSNQNPSLSAIQLALGLTDNSLFLHGEITSRCRTHV